MSAMSDDTSNTPLPLPLLSSVVSALLFKSETLSHICLKWLREITKPHTYTNQSPRFRLGTFGLGCRSADHLVDTVPSSWFRMRNRDSRRLTKRHRIQHCFILVPLGHLVRFWWPVIAILLIFESDGFSVCHFIGRAVLLLSLSSSFLLAYFPYFEKIKVVSWDLQLCIPPINFWMPEPLFMKLGMYSMVSKPLSTACFTHSSHQSVSICVSHYRC
jgi:hypothetical protein